MREKILILGAGLAGLSTAYHLGEGYELFEKENGVGGLCRSRRMDGFTFDYDGHLLHFREEYTKKLLSELMDGNLLSHDRGAWIYSKGVFTRYPFQANVHGLPPNVVKECIQGLIQARRSAKPRCTDGEVTLEDWILKTFGRGIAEHFMLPYNEKFWTVHPREMSSDWVDKYIPVPTVEEAVSGALFDAPKRFGYNSRFWYPARGGIEEIAHVFEKRIGQMNPGRGSRKPSNGVNLSFEAAEIDIAKRRVRFKNGEERRFDKLVSTIPLVELVGLLVNPPKEIFDLSRNLRYSSIFVLNLGIDRSEISDKHWIYFPEDSYVFFRVGFPTNFSTTLAPEGKSSLYAEVSYSNNKPVNKTGLPGRIIKDLIHCGIISDTDKISAMDKVDIKFGYCLYDKNRTKSVDGILEYLSENNIFSIGRYGRWSYMSMEGAILDGKETAEAIDKSRE